MAHFPGLPAADWQRMDVRRFAECIERLTAQEIDAIASAHRALGASVADEVEAWQVLLAVDRGLKAAHRNAARLVSLQRRCGSRFCGRPNAATGSCPTER